MNEQVRKNQDLIKENALLKQRIWELEQSGSELNRIKEALRKSEANYRQLFENFPNGIYQVNFRTGKFSKANDAFCEYLGYNQEEITSITQYDVLTKESQKLFSERLNKIALGEKVPENPEFEIINKNGKKRWVQLNIKFIHDSEDIVGADVVAHDITERKQAEEALKESEEKFRSLTETTSDLVWEVDTTGVYTYASPKIMELLGYEPEEVLGKTPFDLMPPAEKKRVARIFQGAVQLKGPLNAIENTNLHKSGQVVVLETSAVSITDREGNLVGYRGIDRDITERKRAEEALQRAYDELEQQVEDRTKELTRVNSELRTEIIEHRRAEETLRESQRQLADIIDFLPDATLVIDKKGKVIAWNRAIEDMTGIKAKEMIGKDNFEYALPFYGKRIPMLVNLIINPKTIMKNRYSSFLREKGILKGEVVVPFLKGNERILSCIAAPFYDNKGKIVGAIESLRDITE